MKRLLTATALALTAVLALSGCGDTDAGTNTGPRSSAATAYNDPDVTFAQQMIPHHQQAVQMSRMAKSHDSTMGVKELAANIEKAQGPEIDTMTRWLKDWGTDVPTGYTMGHSMGSMGDMPGMMSDQDMLGLDRVDGATFARMFLTMMVKHHEGAITMAKTEQATGENADAVALAKTIEDAQTAEIALMKSMLKALPQG